LKIENQLTLGVMCGGGAVLHADYADYADRTGARRSAHLPQMNANEGSQMNANGVTIYDVQWG